MTGKNVLSHSPFSRGTRLQPLLVKSFCWLLLLMGAGHGFSSEPAEAWAKTSKDILLKSEVAELPICSKGQHL